MDTGREQDNSDDEIFSSLVRPYKPPSYADFAENETSYFYTCVDCGDRYFLESSLRIHLSRESVSITYFCMQCGKNLQYKNRCNLLAHLREHPAKDREELPVTVRPLSENCEDIGFVKTSRDVSALEKTREDVNSLKNTNDVVIKVPPSKSSSSPIIKKGFITVTKIVDSPVQFPKSNVKLISTNAKLGEVKVIINPQSQETPSVAPKSVMCKECGIYSDKIRSHFLEDNKPLNVRLRCLSCDLILPTKCSHKAHVRIHLKKAPFVCPDCMKEFAFYELLMVHLKYFCFHLEKIPRFICQACSSVFPSLGSLEVHLASKHVKPVYKCMACPRAFFEVKLLDEHKLQSHGEAKVSTKFFEQCQLCPQKLLTKSCLFLHIHEHVTSKGSCYYCYKCTRCGLVTENKLEFSSHRLSCSDAQNDVNAIALAKLAKENLLSDAFDENNSSPKVKAALTFCLPYSSSSSATNSNISSNVSLPNGIIKNISVTSSVTEGQAHTARNKTVSSSNLENQTTSSHEKNFTDSVIPQRVYKACGWHPGKCLLCKNELVVGTLKAWKNLPANYEGCCKWKLGSVYANSLNSLKVVSSSAAYRKSFKKNGLALNGPSHSSKLGQLCPISDTFLCHICKHSLQIDHGIIQKHFRQQHPDVEIMSLKPLVQKLDFSKSNVPLQMLRFSVKPSKVLQVLVNKSKANASQTVPKKKVPQGRQKQVMNGIKSVNNVKTWMKCKECSFKTKNKKVYKRHVNSHNIIRYECKECNLQFVSEPSYKIHLVMRHGIEEGKRIKNGLVKNKTNDAEVQGLEDDTTTGKLKCKVCQKSFTNYGDLQKHFRIHGMAFLMLNKDERIWRKV